jgi:hypothetical protein
VTSSSRQHAAAFGKIWLRIFCLVPAACCLLSLSGCLAGALLSKTLPQTVPAHYMPNQSQPMLVLAEDYRNPNGDAVLDADQLARFVYEDLQHHDAARLIDPLKGTELRSRDPSTFRQMPIAQIGKTSGAGQVLYISVTGTDVQSPAGSGMMRAEAAALVRVVDVRTGQTLWPDSAADGYPVGAQTPMVKLTEGADETTVRQALQHQLAIEIARLFYKYEPDAD